MQTEPSPHHNVPLHEFGQRLSELRLCQPAAEEWMRHSLEHHGQLTAVVAFINEGELQLVDGFKRMRAAKRLGWTSLKTRILPLDPVTATAVIGVLHEHHKLSELEEAWIIFSLCREHKMTQGAVAQLLRRHKSWVSRRLLLAEGLDTTVQADVRLGLLPARSAIALAALPRGNQKQAAELVMQRGMTTRQAETLVKRLREHKSDQARSTFMLEYRGEQRPPTSKERSPRSIGEQLLADIAMVMRVGVRLEVRLLQRQLGQKETEGVREALEQLAPLLNTLGTAIHRALRAHETTHATMANP